MENKIFFIAGALVFAFLFFILRYLSSKQNREYSNKVKQILNAEENKVKGQFGR
ncbi:hypothetical protein KY312_02655 [Candidatus Woesearchaeota archaeon]|nr:hypothetical protein [Candidatus Woesearchaeota archaeon]